MAQQAYIDTDWAKFINDMMSVQGQPAITVSITGTECALQGIGDNGGEFVITLDTDEAGVQAVRRVAGLLGFPVREYQNYPALVSSDEEVQF